MVMHTLCAWITVFLLGGFASSAALIPQSTPVRNTYTFQAAESLQTWERVIGDLGDAEDLAGQPSNERQSLADARLDLQEIERSLYADFDLLKTADSKMWPTLQTRMQQKFLTMKRALDKL